jgi:putative adhesin
MPTFTTPGPIAATVQVAGARVRVGASDRTDTVVHVEPVNKDSKSDLKVAEKTKVEFSDGQLTVKTTRSGDKNGSVAITIDLPAGSSLAVDLAHSSVHADGPLGDCELQMSSGQVQLDRINALRANAAGGEVTVAHIAGPASIEAASCSFDIARADGSVSASTASGAVRIGRLARGHAELVTGSGNIEVAISQGSAVRVDAKSERASVRNSIPPQEDPGTFNDEVTVHAHTRDGDIIIKRAAS